MHLHLAPQMNELWAKGSNEIHPRPVLGNDIVRSQDTNKKVGFDDERI